MDEYAFRIENQHAVLVILKKFFNFLPSDYFLFILLFLTIFFTTVIPIHAQDPIEDLEEISMLVEIPNYGYFSVEALYASDKKVYLALESFFATMGIPCEVGKQGDSLGGFIISENNRYFVDYLTGQISIGKIIFPAREGMIKRMGVVYLESALYKQAFGLELKFNFRSLLITVKSSFELPVIKKLRLEKIRSNLRKIRGEVLPDTTLTRTGHLFRPGTLNWSVIGSQLSGGRSDNQFSLGIGSELLYGELDIYLNYSTQTKFNNGQQQFLWRWVDNSKKVVRQIMAGRIANTSISTIYSPMHGAILTNAPTTMRRTTGFYTIRDYTQPDWFVELYLNNGLVDFVKADAAGMFTFKVPLVYGYTTLTLKFYGPNGEERSEQRTMNVPYNFLPARTFEYRISGAVVSDSLNSRFARGEFTYGVGRSLSLGAGIEYLSSVSSGPVIPFANLSLLPFSKLIISGMYAYGVGFNGLLNLFLPYNSQLQVNYILYSQGQKAVQYNYREQRMAVISVPLRLRKIGGSLRAGIKQDVYPGFTYNLTEFILSAGYRQFSVNLSANGNWVSNRPLYAFSNLAFSYRFKSGLAIRAQGQMNISARQFNNLRIDAEKKVVKSGYLSLSYDWNIPESYHGVNLTFRYNLPFAQTAFSTRLTNQGLFTSEGISGGLSFGSGKGFVDAAEVTTVGRGGLSLIPFVDINNNSIFDDNEPMAKGLVVSGNGGRLISSKKDSIIRIFGLEPFSYFDLELREGDFDNLSWRLKHKSYRILIDPNQFKRVEIPILPMGEITGNVFYAEDTLSRGIGRIQVNIFKINGEKYAQTLSETDGYMSYLGMVPGDYYAQVDTLQLKRIGFSVEPKIIPFTIHPMYEGDIVDGVEFTVRPVVRDTTGATGAGGGIPVKALDLVTDTLNTGKFAIEIGNLIDELEAMNVQTRLKSVLDLTAIIVTENGIMKIQLQGFNGRAAAEAVLTKVKGLGYSNALVVRMK